MADADTPGAGQANGRRQFSDRRSGGLISQISMVLLRPGGFFHALPPIKLTRQWVWVAILILALSGYSAVRQESSPDANGNTDGNTDMMPPNMGFDSGLGGESMFGGVPEMSGQATTNETGSKSDPSQAWATGLIAASILVLEWLALAVILSEVSMLNSSRPRFGKNLQIAIWASVPLGLMAALQLLYIAVGGKVGVEGLSGLLSEWEGYNDLTKFQRSLVLSFASRLTLFWLWTLLLVYFGARYSLHGKWLASLIALVAWVIVLVLIPVLTGDIEAEDPATDDVNSDTLFPDDSNFSPNDLFPEEFFPDFPRDQFSDGVSDAEGEMPDASFGDELSNESDNELEAPADSEAISPPEMEPRR